MEGASIGFEVSLSQKNNWIGGLCQETIGFRNQREKGKMYKLRKHCMAWKKHLGHGARELSISLQVRIQQMDIRTWSVCERFKWKLPNHFVLYVDDLLITRPNEAEVTKLKTCMMNGIEMPDLENLAYLLCIEFVNIKFSVLLHYKKYAEEI